MTTLADVGRGVISERHELHGSSWVDCTQAAAMRACADAGVVFPLVDLDQEREALERADDYPDETGATMAAIVTAMQRRYQYSGDPVSDLHAALRTPGYTLLVQGAYPQFPSIQRRWSPKFQGGHAVAYRVTSEILGTLLDPLAPMGFAGDTVTPAVMEAFAWGAATTRAMRWLKPPQTSTPAGDPPMRSFSQPAIGGAHLVGAGHSCVTLDGSPWDGPWAAGTNWMIVGEATLDTPLPGGVAGADRSHILLVRPDKTHDGKPWTAAKPACLLRMDTDWPAGKTAAPVANAPTAPLIPDVKHVVTVTTAFDGVSVNSFSKAV